MDTQEIQNLTPYQYFMVAMDHLLDKYDGKWQAKLARDSGVDKTTISKVHKGERNYSPEAQEAIAKSFGFPSSLEMCNLGKAIHHQEDGWELNLRSAKAINILEGAVKRFAPSPATPEELRVQLSERTGADIIAQDPGGHIRIIETKSVSRPPAAGDVWHDYFSKFFNDRVFLGGAAKRPDDEFVKVPLVEARLSAGGGSLETGSGVKSHLAFRRDWLAQKGRASAMVVMCVAGDSMWPKIEEGDVLLVDLSQTDPVHKGVYAVNLNGELLVKRVNTGAAALDDIVFTIGDGDSLSSWDEAQELARENYQLFTLESDLGMFNQRYVERTRAKRGGLEFVDGPQTILIEKADEFKVLGRVVWLGRDMGR